LFGGVEPEVVTMLRGDPGRGHLSSRSCKNSISSVYILRIETDSGPAGDSSVVAAHRHARPSSSPRRRDRH
jgi:hypothetical protein